MILFATFSKPAKNVEEVLGKAYVKVRFWRGSSAALNPSKEYEAEFFTEKQSFRKHFSQKEFEEFEALHAGSTFRNVVERTESLEITKMANRRGEVKTLERKLKKEEKNTLKNISVKSENRSKNYILPEKVPVPFLVRLGVMTEKGAVVAQKYDKFRQINRFLEYVRDILPDMLKLQGGSFTKERPLTVIDFGSGKSYLTFALYYYLTELEHIPVKITGLDLKADVIADCQKLAKDLGCTDLNFKVGDIAKYSENSADMVITLHACDTATDYALDYAVSRNAKVILSVPCCQHEINLQLKKKGSLPKDNPFKLFADYGILQERLSALATDAVRAALLESRGYSVQVLEFIDMSHTPKNLLIRAVKKTSPSPAAQGSSLSLARSLLQTLGVSQTLNEIIEGR